MMDTKYQTENSFFYEEFENDSWIENELEEKLWVLYDRRKNQTRLANSLNFQSNTQKKNPGSIRITQGITRGHQKGKILYQTD